MSRDRMTLAATLVALFVLTMGVPVASADNITYVLGTGNAALQSSYPGPYANVSVNWTDSTTANVTFTALTASGYAYMFGDGGTADLNVNGTYSLGTVGEVNTYAGFSPSFKQNAPGNVSDFGNFNLSLNNNGGYTNAATTISFTLTASGSTTWANAADVLTPNAYGNVAAAHIFVASIGTDGKLTSTANTGFAGVPASVPDGGVTLMMLGGALIGLETVRRRFRA